MFSQSLPGRAENGWSGYCTTKRKCNEYSTVEVGDGGCAYLKWQILWLLKVVWAGVSTCTLKVACFLEAINWSR
jgi:hypothetical protein